MTMITPSYLGETIEYSSLHACRSTLEDPTFVPRSPCEKIVSFFLNSATFRNTPAESRKSWALNAPLALVFRRVIGLRATIFWEVS